MFLIFAGLVGLLAGLSIHWITWYARSRHLSLTVILGALSALGLTWFCLLFLNSDIARQMLIVLAILWGLALGIGSLQARSLPAPWWKGVLAVFFEMVLAFVTGAAVNLTLQRYISWLEQSFPGIDVYAIINAFLWTLIVTLLVLAVVRLLVWRPHPQAGV